MGWFGHGKIGMVTEKEENQEKEKNNERKTTDVKGYLYLYLILYLLFISLAGRGVNYTLASKHLVLSIITSTKHKKINYAHSFSK